MRIEPWDNRVIGPAVIDTIATGSNTLSSKTERAQTAQEFASTIRETRFACGSMVLVSLNSPREKFWGEVLELAPAGVSLRGIELNCFEDFSRQVKAGDPVTPNAVFFPMHRIERNELDSPNGEIPSLQARFASQTGREFREVLQGRAPGRRSKAGA